MTNDQNKELIREFAGRFILVALVIGAAGAGVYSLVTPVCACTPLHVSQQAVVKAELRGMLLAQESHFADNVTYTSAIDALDQPSHDSVSVTITSADIRGWAASAEWPSDNYVNRCHIFVGAAPPAFAEMREGEPYCEPE